MNSGDIDYSFFSPFPATKIHEGSRSEIFGARPESLCSWQLKMTIGCLREGREGKVKKNFLKGCFSDNTPAFYREIKAVQNETPIIIVDEIQKIPILLNEIHRLLEESPHLRFIMSEKTGIGKEIPS